MKKKTYIYLAFSQGRVGRKEADRLIEALSAKTLQRITGNKFDKRLIRPVLVEANRLIENSNDNDEGMDLEFALNQILDNKEIMFGLMSRYCMGD